MVNRTRTPAAIFLAVVLALAGLAGVSLVAAASASAASPAFTGIVPPANPPANVAFTTGGVYPECLTPTSDSDSCLWPILHAIDHARSLEGVGSITLPTNWDSLTVDQQIFVVLNLERVSRGLPAIVGISPVLNADAQVGANETRDPSLGQDRTYGSIWAGGFPDALYADYGWMYQDGYGGSNGECVTPTSSGCWGHRDIILSDESCSNCVMGVGYSDAVSYRPSYAAVFAQATPATSDLTFTWAANVAPYLAHPLRVNNPNELPPVTTHLTSTTGYRMVAGDGGVFDFGDAQFHGSMGGKPLNKPVVASAATPTGNGYWEVAGDGGIFSFNAPFHGSMGGKPLNQPIVGMAVDSATGGYWEVASDGGIFSFDAPFSGSMGGKPLNKPIVGMAATPTGGGYWLVASDGGIFSFGNAQFHGSMGGKPLNQPIVGMAADPTTGGYWEVASTGGIFTFDASFHGSATGHASSTVVGMAPAPTGNGYWIGDATGQVFAEGVPTDGTMTSYPLNQPMVGFAVS